MLKMKKLTLAIVMATSLAGCANISDSYQAGLDNYKQYEEITKQYNVKENWWALYNDAQLNRVVEQALLGISILVLIKQQKFGQSGDFRKQSLI